MAITPAVLIESKYAPNSQTTEYTSSDVKTVIDSVTVFNDSGANVTLAINLVPSGGSVSGGNTFVNRTILAGKSDRCPELVGQILDPGGFISVLAGTLNGLSIRASGRQISD